MTQMGLLQRWSTTVSESTQRESSWPRSHAVLSQPVVSERQGRKVSKAWRDRLVHKEIQDRRARLASKVPQVLRVQQEPRVIQAQQGRRANPDRRVLRVRKATLVRRERKGRRAFRGYRARRETRELRAFRARKVPLGRRVMLGLKASKDRQVLPEQQTGLSSHL